MLVKNDGDVRVLPDFLIVGAAKSGTTSLYFYLRQHPSIFIPTDAKEPGFFCFTGRERPREPAGHPYPGMWDTAIFEPRTYTALFDGARPDQLLGDATPEYLYLYNATIANIKKYYGTDTAKLKLAAVLRNPIERIWSHYWMALRDKFESIPFEDAISNTTISKRLEKNWHPSYDYVGFGRYSAAVKAYVNAFGRDNVKIILFDQLQTDANSVCADLFRYLGVDPTLVPDVSLTYNASGQIKHPGLHKILFLQESALKSIARTIVPYERLQRIKHTMLVWNTRKVQMPTETRKMLGELYYKEIEELSSVLELDLSPWLRGALVDQQRGVGTA